MMSLIRQQEGRDKPKSGHTFKKVKLHFWAYFEDILSVSHCLFHDTARIHQFEKLFYF